MKNSQKGRNLKRCAIYELEGRRVTNKIIKMNKHIKRHPNDTITKQRLKELS